MRTTLVIGLCLAAMAGLGCSTTLSDLDRADQHFQKQQHERALALFRLLEPDMGKLSPPDRARYAYLRGMTDYRLSGGSVDGSPQAGSPLATDDDKKFRSHARYWLGLALAFEQVQAGSLRAEWMASAKAALRDLNQDVYGEGIFADDGSTPVLGEEAPAAQPDGAGR